MFDIGFQELILIFIVALLVVGPKKLPEVGRSVGKGIAELKRAMQNLKDSISDEENLLKKEIPDFQEDLVSPLKKGLEDGAKAATHETGSPPTESVTTEPGPEKDERQENEENA